MTPAQRDSDGATRVAQIVGVPLAPQVTDYWGEPSSTPDWCVPMTERLEMPGDGIWPDNPHLAHH